MAINGVTDLLVNKHSHMQFHTHTHTHIYIYIYTGLVNCPLECGIGVLVSEVDFVEGAKLLALLEMWTYQRFN